MLIEAAVESVDAAVAAAEGGAHRIELCLELSSGGTTPDVQLLRDCHSRVPLPIFVLVRPRPGNFLYSDDEHRTMRGQIQLLKQAGARGIVTGALTFTQQVHEAQTVALIEAAWPLPVTFHRAFDDCIDLSGALEILIKLEVERVLTSGGARTAADGAAQIAKLVTQARERIEILAGGGINETNVARLVAETGVREVHFSVTNAEKVRAVMRALEHGED